jgi:hypothetical protein
LVEGASDAKIIQTLVKNLTLPEVPSSEPITKVLKIIAVSGKLAEFKFDEAEPRKQAIILDNLLLSYRASETLRLGIIVDADDDATVTFNKIVEKLIQSKYFPRKHLPTAPYANEGSDPSKDRCSVFITPYADNVLRNGTLEHYFLEALCSDNSPNSLNKVNKDAVVQFAKQALGVDVSLDNTNDLFNTVGNHGAKWLTSACLLTLAKRTYEGRPLQGNALLKQGCQFTADFGYACESKKPIITDLHTWKNLQALRDYLTAFLAPEPATQPLTTTP